MYILWIIILFVKFCIKLNHVSSISTSFSHKFFLQSSLSTWLGPIPPHKMSLLSVPDSHNSQVPQGGEAEEVKCLTYPQGPPKPQALHWLVHNVTNYYLYLRMKLNKLRLNGVLGQSTRESCRPETDPEIPYIYHNIKVNHKLPSVSERKANWGAI